MKVLGLLLVVVVVFALGYLIGRARVGSERARFRSVRTSTARPPTATPVVRVRADQAATPAGTLTVGGLLELVLQQAPSGVVVVNAFRDVIIYNDRAVEFGLINDRLIHDDAWDAAELALAGHGDQFVEMSTKRPAGAERSHLSIRVQAHVVQLGGIPASPFPTERPNSDESPSSAVEFVDEDRPTALRLGESATAGAPSEGRLVMLFANDDTEGIRLEATRRDFVANVSHELKTPVGAIGLLAEALLESVDDPESVRHFGSRVLTESNRMGNMVNELIALSRLQGADKLPDLGVVEVDEIINEAVHRSRTTAEAANIDLVVDEDSDYQVRGDDTLLLTALSNLIANAIAYSPPQTAVSVSRRYREPDSERPHGAVEIAVTDRGIGIAAENQERVFERFFRVDKARSRMTGGTGLGLAIVKHVVANHDGAVRLWSKPGMGSTFTIEIPSIEHPAIDELDPA